MHDKLTQSDIDKLQEEIDYRKLTLRPQILKEVQEARAQGDLSENFEYYAARKAKGENDSRISYLENMIRTAILVDESSEEGTVGLNKRVKVCFEDENDTEEFKIVTSVRASSMRGLITPESPVGRALMGHRVGDRVHVRVNDQVEYDVTVTGIEDVGEEESDTIRSF